MCAARRLFPKKIDATLDATDAEATPANPLPPTTSRVRIGRHCRERSRVQRSGYSRRCGLLDFDRQELLERVTLDSHLPVPVRIPIPRQDFVLEIFSDITWVPRLLCAESRDDRELGIGIRRFATAQER